eukprot:7879524-Alexandrium_andersonii.AAC.1
MCCTDRRTGVSGSWPWVHGRPRLTGLSARSTGPGSVDAPGSPPCSFATDATAARPRSVRQDIRA